MNFQKNMEISHKSSPMHQCLVSITKLFVKCVLASKLLLAKIPQYTHHQKKLMLGGLERFSSTRVMLQ